MREKISSIFENEVKVTEGKIEKTMPYVFSGDENLDIGGGSGSAGDG